jgi:hypothetical protein
MTRLPRLGTLLLSSFLLGACAQLIGLSDYETVDEDSDGGEDNRAGKGGGGGKAGAGSGGAGQGGTGGKAGGGAAGSGGTGGSVGGEAGAGAGGDAGDAGSSGSGGAGEAGEAGEAGAGGQSGSGTGGGGVSGGGGTGGGGTGGCVEITALTYTEGNLDHSDPTFMNTVYRHTTSPNVGTAPGIVDFEFYQGTAVDGAAVGTFTLGGETGIDSNYETCARCLHGYSDGDTVQYFATAGTMVIDSASDQLNGYVNLSITDVTMREVTIDGNFHSTVVEGGRCMHVTYLDIVARLGWTCDQDFYGDTECDCGCGVPDIDCATNYGGACLYCEMPGSCGNYNCSNINPTDNSNCDPQTIGWDNALCSGHWYGDGECDCGCGTVDVDCTDATVASCSTCWCDPEGKGFCTGTTNVNPTDNGECLPVTP